MMPVMVGRKRRHSTARKPRKMAGRNGWCEPPQPAIFVALVQHYICVMLRYDGT